MFTWVCCELFGFWFLWDFCFGGFGAGFGFGTVLVCFILWVGLDCLICCVSLFGL